MQNKASGIMFNPKGADSEAKFLGLNHNSGKGRKRTQPGPRGLSRSSIFFVGSWNDVKTQSSVEGCQDRDGSTFIFLQLSFRQSFGEGHGNLNATKKSVLFIDASVHGVWYFALPLQVEQGGIHCVTRTYMSCAG